MSLLKLKLAEIFTIYSTGRSETHQQLYFNNNLQALTALMVCQTFLLLNLRFLPASAILSVLPLTT